MEAIANAAELVGSSDAWVAAHIGRRNIGGLVEFEPLTLWSYLVARAREVAACEFSEADEIQPTARAG